MEADRNRPDRAQRIAAGAGRALRPLLRLLTGFVLPLLVLAGALGAVEALLQALGMESHGRQIVRLLMFAVYAVIAIRLIRGSGDHGPQGGDPGDAI